MLKTYVGKDLGRFFLETRILKNIWLVQSIIHKFIDS